MASLYPKRIAGKTYWYLREMARVDGKPKMVSERYVGSAAEVAALLDAREQAGPGTYLALAALNRLVAPCSKAAFADWWKSTAADRFTKITARAPWTTGGSGTPCTRSPRSSWSGSAKRSRCG
jgi:hypothetical protein